MENKKYTLLNFLKEDNTSLISIEIPIIQRDYAQGRSDKRSKEIRETFLKTLIRAIEEKVPLELDFVYGKRDKNKAFLLDGQQRITTLYLLHWYIAQRIRKPSLLKEVTLGYHVRQYADEFTQKLSDENILIDFSSSIPCVAVCDCSWFFEAWKHDPTVSGMLNTLDTIHELLKDKKINEERYWQPLEEGAVTFYWLDLEEHHLTDELYLKMNARGKQLSNFENFKASLVKRVADNGWEKNTPKKDSFSFKMDTDYTDLFWQYRGDQTVIDNEAMNFFAGMAMIGYALKENSGTQQERIQELFKNPLSVRVEDFEKSDFERFTSYLNFYSEEKNISIETELWKYYNTNNKRGFFEEFIKDENKGTQKAYRGATYKQRVFFYAITNLFIKVKDNKAKIEEFIQVVRNIIENEAIDSAETFAGAIKLMRELLDGSPDIYDYLSKTAIQSNFASYQVTQEKQKAERIVADSQWKEAIWKAEDHPMFKGDIGFLLLETENNLALFKKRYEVAKEMFDENGIKGKYRENALLLRALISRFDSWKLLFDIYYDLTAYNWKSYILKTIYKEKENDITKHFLTLLDNEDKLEAFIKDDSSLQQGYWSDEDFRIRKNTHINLYQTELLAAICEICNERFLKESYGYFYLHIHNGRKDNRYFVYREQHEILAKAIEDGIITTEQQLEVNGKKIPFFRGQDINFNYNNEEYTWAYSDNKITKNGQDCTEEAMQKIFSFSL